MRNKKHTTGKLAVKNLAVLIDNQLVADFAFGRSAEENEANAHLFASAGDMYEMLERVLKETPANWLDDEDYERRQDIIKLLKKARGE